MIYLINPNKYYFFRN